MSRGVVGAILILAAAGGLSRADDGVTLQVSQTGTPAEYTLSYHFESGVCN